MARYGKSAGKFVRSAMRRRKHGTLRSGRRGKGGESAVGIGALDPGDGGTRGVRGDVFDVAEVDAVNAGEVGEGVLSAEVKDDDALRFGIVFVVGEGGFNEELFTDEAGRRVAAFADIAGGAQVLDRRLDGGGIGVERDLDELLGSVDLGAHVGAGAGADVAGDAIDVGVRGDFVSGVLGMHHVAGLPAELGRIHIGRAAIAGHSDNQQVDDGGDEHDVDAMAEHAVVEIDFRKLRGNLAGFLESLAAEIDTDGDEDEATDEECGQDEKEDDAEVRVFFAAAEEFVEPVGDHGDAGGAGDCAAEEADGVVAEEERRPHPVFAEFL